MGECVGVSRYNQSYRVAPLPLEWLKCWNDPGEHESLALPEINPFTPVDLTMLSADDAAAPHPQILVKDSQLTL